ncbi:MAG TPA: ATP-binding protein [Chitinophagaceae bacterium]|nr:ATP-binding protein [Chitinophagaceae bacterium]
MLKRYLHIICLLALPILCIAQNNQLIDAAGAKKIDSLKRQILPQNSDSGRITVMNNIGFFYETLNADSSVKYYQAALDIAMQRGIAWGEARLMASLSGTLRQQGRLAEALDLLFKSIKIAKDNNLSFDLARAYRRTGDVYYDLDNFPKAVEYTLQAVNIDEQKENKINAAIDHWSLSDAYEKMHKLDSAIFHLDKAFTQNDLLKNFIQSFYEINGNIQAKKGNYEEAHNSYTEGLKFAQQNSDLATSSRICADISTLLKETNRKDSAIFYATKGFAYSQEASFKKGIMLSGNLLAELYDSSQPVTALKYFKIAAAAKDSLFGVDNIQTIQNLVSREEAKQKELEDAQISYHNRLKVYGLLTGLAALLVIAFILYGNNKQKQKANIVLQQQKQKVESTLSELKSTQAQLIQSEKMASLGELTAGIAHEIQNPLNFVNNFSEVNKEMIEEATEEIDKGNTAEVKNILNNIKDNSEKINHHGKRADAIVKGMMQHSQKNSGQKELTDINALADEYLRLSYHGMRAKDKSFNAILKTDFDEDLSSVGGKINIIPQDIGRVLLNLYNNAFFAVNEKKKTANENYQPLVSVRTKKLTDKVEIKVSDNGNGIPQNIVDKIFQPFFTTKPTGQGTGLGLSLSYDIIKVHGGEIKVESKEDEGSVFIVQLPLPQAP